LSDGGGLHGHHQATAYDEQGEKKSDEVHRRKVAAQITGAQVSAKPSREVETVEELSEELQAGEGREAVAREAERQIGLDWSRQIAFSMSHGKCLSGTGRSW
jgi:hypothetical protein